MKRRSPPQGKSAASGKSVKSRPRRAPSRRRGKAVGRPSPAAAETAGLRRELKEAREQQTALTEVLQVISASPGELQPVFDIILANATRICQAKLGTLYRFDGEKLHFAAEVGAPRKLAEFYKQRGPHPPPPGSHIERVVRTKRPSQAADYSADAVPGPAARLAGAGSTVWVPMLKDDAVVGVILVYRQEVRLFTDEQIALLENFAAQAVVAIENARLLNELKQRTIDLSESLEQQTATADVLRIISSSPGNLDPVFQAMLENAVRICDAKFGIVFRIDDGIWRFGAEVGTPKEYAEFSRTRPPFVPDPGTVNDRVLRTKQVCRADDYAAEAVLGRAARLGGARSTVGVPMLKDGVLIGSILIYRQQVRPFTEKQIALVENFAAQAVIAIENARLLNELRQSLEQQTATADVLRVISASPGELDPVFAAILDNATRICEAKFGTLYLYDGNAFHFRAEMGSPPEYAEFQRRRGPFQPIPGTHMDRITRTKQVSQTADAAAEPVTGPVVTIGGARSFVGVPMLKDDVLIGMFGVYRQEVRPFTDKQIALVQNFAAQAVIAIENARLLNELRQRTADLTESLEQQTATSEVLRVISSSPGDLQPVFQAMLENAVRICGAKFGNMLLRVDGDQFHFAAGVGVPAALADFHRQHEPFLPTPDSPLAHSMQTKRPFHLADGAAAPIPSPPARLAGARSMVCVPMLKDDAFIGAIVIYRQEVRPFSAKEIELLTNFAAQAVIAIENTRLLSELRQSLERQTATADVLRVISASPGHLEPVFNEMLKNAMHICEANFGILFLYEPEGFRAVSVYGESYWSDWFRSEPMAKMRDHPGTPLDRLTRARKTIHIPDLRLDQSYLDGNPRVVSLVDTAGGRTEIVVPLLREDELIGAIIIYRQEVRPFNDKQIALVENFAAQAVIAIENARLLNELRQSLEQQTATADVLRVISSSPGELKPVFDAMLANATRICKAEFGFLWLAEDDGFRCVALCGVPAEFAEKMQRNPVIHPGPLVPLRRVAATKQADHSANLLDDPAYKAGDPSLFGFVDATGARTHLLVPMLKEGDFLGAISIYRKEVRLFTDEQVGLVTNFANQAVIAIENTRLLSELRQSLEQQTATSEVLRVISASPGDLQPVFQATIDNATRLCGAKFGALSLREGENFRSIAMHGVRPAYIEERQRDPIIRPTPGHNLERLLHTGAAVHVPDLASDVAAGQALFERAGARALLNVPLLKGGDIIGSIMIYREEPGAFTDKQIELVTNFAAQAVIAIENARLLNELRQRTDDLSKSLDDLRTAQDRLVQTQKLAELGQLTAGIAHEIKNPLNFVNNFSVLSAELVEELQDTLSRVAADDQTRGEIADLADTLRGNLDKIVQHGKRADSIVKNMLQHSREGSGDRRPVNINAIVEESLNLAYHGARAEKQGFTITLERAFDPQAGEAHVFPQELSRVLLNLIANGFYAAAKRQAGSASHEAVLSAATKNLGDSVEIRIRDNGTGIPPEVKEKMFNPFFTTKPAGEGTGLGLSISHDIIVKQHSGSIQVDSEPGEFTEIRIVLPRAVA